jgi:hypothetical protein
MSILIGKSDATLTAFNVTGQTPTPNSFRNMARSINKSGQVYQFREKMGYDLEFNYMPDSDYQTLSAILRNRNSLREGLIFQPIPYAGAASSIIDLSGAGAVNKAYKFATDTDPLVFTGSKTEFNSTEYGYVSAYNSSYVNWDSGGGDYNGFILKFSLAAFIAAFASQELRRLTLVIHGMKTSPVRFAIWDQVNSSWYPIDDRFEYNSAQLTTAGFYLYRQLVTAMGTPWGTNTLFDNYAADGTVTFMVVAGNPAEPMALQYARLFVNGYWVMEDEGGNFESFASAFTGAGRSGTLKLLEI